MWEVDHILNAVILQSYTLGHVCLSCSSLLPSTATPFNPPSSCFCSLIRKTKHKGSFLTNIFLTPVSHGDRSKRPPTPTPPSFFFSLPLAARMWNLSQLAFSPSHTSTHAHTHSQMQHPPSRCLLLPSLPSAWVSLSLSLICLFLVRILSPPYLNWWCRKSDQRQPTGCVITSQHSLISD